MRSASRHSTLPDPEMRATVSSRAPPVDTRVQIAINGQKLKGKVGFVGKTEFAAGIWVGVILDSPNGKNDGTVKNKSYFSCQPLHGLFIREHNIVKVLRSQRSNAELENSSELLDSSTSTFNQEPQDLPDEGQVGSKLVDHDVAHLKRIATDRELVSKHELLESELESALQHAKSEAALARQHAQQLSLCEEQQAESAAQAAVKLSSASSEVKELAAELAEASKGGLRLECEMEHAEEAARRSSVRREELQSALSEAESQARCISQATESSTKQLGQLQSELDAEKSFCQRQTAEISRLELVVQKERNLTSALQRDYNDAMQLADAAREDLAQQRRGGIERAKTMEAAEATITQREAELRQEIMGLRATLRAQELKQAELHGALRTTKPETSSLPGSFSFYVKSYICCSRPHRELPVTDSQEEPWPEP